MKHALLALLFFCIVAGISAQKYSCDLAYRFDAAYTKTFDQLDNVSIFLNQPKAITEETRGGKNIVTGPFYYISGNTSNKAFQSLDANIGFLRCYLQQPNLELYKADVRNGMRTFTVPAGANGNHSINIPIQVNTPPSLKNPNNGQVEFGSGNFKIKFLNGYLTAGEYILIDKQSVSADGSQMKGYAFTIK